MGKNRAVKKLRAASYRVAESVARLELARAGLESDVAMIRTFAAKQRQAARQQRRDTLLSASLLIGLATLAVIIWFRLL